MGRNEMVRLTLRPAGGVRSVPPDRRLSSITPHVEHHHDATSSIVSMPSLASTAAKRRESSASEAATLPTDSLISLISASGSAVFL